MEPKLLMVACTRSRSPDSSARNVLWGTRWNFHRHEVPVAGRQLADGELPNHEPLPIKTVTTARQFLAEQFASGESASSRCAESHQAVCLMCRTELLHETGRSPPAHFCQENMLKKLSPRTRMSARWSGTHGAPFSWMTGSYGYSLFRVETRSRGKFQHGDNIAKCPRSSGLIVSAQSEDCRLQWIEASESSRQAAPQISPWRPVSNECPCAGTVGDASDVCVSTKACETSTYSIPARSKLSRKLP